MNELVRESWESRLWRWGGNLFPAYRRIGARVLYVSPDFLAVHIKIPCNWKTRNYMGMTWGGGLYAALDPIYGVMLYKALGQKYRVVDKVANIHFKKPGKSTLYARFKIESDELEHIKRILKSQAKLERNYEIDLVDELGVVHATCQKLVSIRSSS